MNQTTDKWSLGGHEFTSRFILGSGKFSLDLVKACVENAGTEIVTLAIRRANEGGLANILDYIPENVTLLPNTSGARTAEEAVIVIVFGCFYHLIHNVRTWISIPGR